MKKSFLFLFLFSLCNFFAQNTNQDWVSMMQDPNQNFYHTKAVFDEYWKDKKVEKGNGFKQFKTWEDYVSPRVAPTGNIGLLAQTWPNYVNWLKENKSEGILKSATFSAWSLVGPVGKPVNTTFANGSGRVNFLRFQPGNSNVMYVGTPNGGLWKSVNGGVSWSTNTGMLSVIGISDLCINPANIQTMYIATGDGYGSHTTSVGVLKSTNGGNTWSPTLFTSQVNYNLFIRKMIMHPTNPLIMFAATNQGVYKTTDGFQTAPTIVQTGNFFDIEFCPNSPSTILVSGSTLFRSTNTGQSFVQVTTGLPTSDIGRISIGVTSANSNRVYLLISKSSNNGLLGVYSSTNSGASFSLKASSPNLYSYDNGGTGFGGLSWYANSIAVSPTKDSVVYSGSINVWRSGNQGVNWTNKTFYMTPNVSNYIHADIHELTFLPGSSTTLFALTDGGIYKSINEGVSWVDISSNLAIAQQYRISQSATNPDFLVAGHQDNGTNKKSGSTWTSVYGGDGLDCLVDRTNSLNILFSKEYGAHLRIFNGGLITGSNAPTSFSNQWLCNLAQDPVNANIVYSAGRPNLIKSLDFGLNWTQLGNIGGIGNVIDFAVAPSNTQFIYAVKYGGIFRSTNGGLNWTNIIGAGETSPPVNNYPSRIIVSPSNSNQIWVTYSGFVANSKVYTTVDGGATWVNLSSGLPNIPVNVIKLIPGTTSNTLVVGMDIGVFTKDNTSNWLEVSPSSLPRTQVRDIEFSGVGATLKMLIATFGRGTFVCSIGNNITQKDLNIAENQENPLVKTNIFIYPNPSKGSFSIEVADEIKQIIIYDVNGNLIEHNFWFNDSMKSNIDLSFLKKGNYFLKIQTEKSSETKQVIIE
jgi:photosystem II stability/assembly factor-like uncharacterized protein